MTGSNERRASARGRRQNEIVDDEVIEEIAERAAEKAIEKITGDVYKLVGKSVVDKMIWIAGAIVVGGYIWLRKIGVIA